ncbi:E3 ubiquitin-protein ligase RNF4 [Galendromus occidentalis]|uniref:E3 ubiquitin-protein ligase RNF4 n=1 Tax=Galendromus occidentalis TaxID=34638 RepID=A0AAJ7P9S4_9ACAR|nr:E3 ubiquitin-protein ligase RNF4 [Galendromus occidentalis]
MSEKKSPEIVDLTIDVTPQRPTRKRKSMYIDLTTPDSDPPSQGAPAGSAGDSHRLEVLYESRSTPVPPSRRQVQKQAAAHVDLAAADDSDSDLPSVHIPGKRSKNKAPVDPPLNIPSCSVCLDTVPELQANNVDLIVMTSCSHFFCKPCADASLKISKKCPRCRVAVRGKSPYKKLYF